MGGISNADTGIITPCGVQHFCLDEADDIDCAEDTKNWRDDIDCAEDTKKHCSVDSTCKSAESWEQERYELEASKARFMMTVQNQKRIDESVRALLNKLSSLPTESAITIVKDSPIITNSQIDGKCISASCDHDNEELDDGCSSVHRNTDLDPILLSAQAQRKTAVDQLSRAGMDVSPSSLKSHNSAELPLEGNALKTQSLPSESSFVDLVTAACIEYQEPATLEASKLSKQPTEEPATLEASKLSKQPTEVDQRSETHTKEAIHFATAQCVPSHNDNCTWVYGSDWAPSEASCSPGVAKPPKALQDAALQESEGICGVYHTTNMQCNRPLPQFGVSSDVAHKEDTQISRQVKCMATSPFMPVQKTDECAVIQSWVQGSNWAPLGASCTPKTEQPEENLQSTAMPKSEFDGRKDDVPQKGCDMHLSTVTDIAHGHAINRENLDNFQIDQQTPFQFQLEPRCSQKWQGWQIQTTGMGQLFYHHQQSAVSQWKMPQELQCILGNWIELSDHHGTNYWWNDLVQLSSWYDPQYTTNIFQAVVAGDMFFMQLYVFASGDINAADENGATALHVACACGNEKMASHLLENGALVNALDFEGSTPLSWACRCNNDAVMRLLLKHGADVKSIDRLGNSLMHIAVEAKSLHAVHCLVQAKASLSHRSPNYCGRTPIELAAAIGAHDVFTFLKKHQVLTPPSCNSWSEDARISAGSQKQVHDTTASYTPRKTVPVRSVNMLLLPARPLLWAMTRIAARVRKGHATRTSSWERGHGVPTLDPEPFSWKQFVNMLMQFPRPCLLGQDDHHRVDTTFQRAPPPLSFLP